MHHPTNGNYSQFPESRTAANWTNLILCTTQVNIAIRYLQGKKQHPLYVWLVLCSLGVDVTCSIVGCANTWQYLVLSVEDPLVNIWELPVAIILNGFSAAFAQVFFVYRYYHLSHDKYLTFFILALVLVHTSSALATGITVATNPSVFNMRAYTLTIVTASSSIAPNVFISIGMIWITRALHTTFKRTRNILRRVAWYAVTCGFTTSLTAILAVTFLFANINGWFVLFWCQGRIYSLTVLANLIALRMSNQAENEMTIPSSFNFDSTDLSRSGVPVVNIAPLDADAHPYIRTVDDDGDKPGSSYRPGQSFNLSRSMPTRGAGDDMELENMDSFETTSHNATSTSKTHVDSDGQ
ncbi:hypothetical protein CYLTODRAFT_491195 [Cylindrobasidium torrendii FP15055 ss-10]|uniref:DUF6534 domain-containing protein n=1 Tax=Cylindrobasidium torrendii FP15055 ss-10 TaxID=1314674 RepID=A0A0D7B8A9_9AGAR|nr:hypothetical protein CYLTODRAFT_491195 [Cylindrobasidium torrendii FP15055 ss-10]